MTVLDANIGKIFGLVDTSGILFGAAWLLYTAGEVLPEYISEASTDVVVSMPAGSLKLPAKALCEAILYESGSFGGQYLREMNDERNDAVSSLKVTGPAGCKVVVYEDYQFSGWNATFGVGEYDMADFLSGGAQNDQVSSLKVIAGPAAQQASGALAAVAPACKLLCGPKRDECPRQPVDHDRKYILLGHCAEQASASRWCVAYGLRLAGLSGRTLVAPRFQDGRIELPSKKAADTDYFDFWDLEPALKMSGARVAPMRDFVQDCNFADIRGNYTCSGVFPDGAVEVLRIAPQKQPEELIAEMLKNVSFGKVLLIKFPNDYCVHFSFAAPVQRREIQSVLDNPRVCIRRYVEDIRSRFGWADAFFVHWRSMSDKLVSIVTNSAMPAPKWFTHHETCAHDVLGSVQKQLDKTGKEKKVVLFSDIHGGCHDGWCGYMEFEGFFHPVMKSDRKRADEFLGSVGWVNGDELVARFLKERPVFDRPDSEVLPMIISELLVGASAVSTCSDWNAKCQECARPGSGFVSEIVRRRKDLGRSIFTKW